MSKSRSVFLIFFFTASTSLIFAQNQTATEDNPLQVKSDTLVAMDTIVIRWEQPKIKIIKRGVRLTSPIISFRDTKAPSEKPKVFNPPSFWKNSNQFNLDISEVAFVNWNAGGDNAVSALANLNFTRNYKFAYTSWQSELRLRYGINAQEGRELRKTDDFIRLSSSFGFRKDSTTSWFYSIKTNFNTQFSNGFKYPDRDSPISRFMAPGYFFLGAGTTYNPDGKKIELYISPITQKMTLVLDENLSNQGAFGVEKGKGTFVELGFLLTHNLEKELFTNVTLNQRLNLYTDYLRSFGNIDIDWEVTLLFKVNKYINANISGHLIYDDDILFDELLAEDGTVLINGIPKVQFKQNLGLGLVYAF